jgi:ABC-2 type transport system ATP-binding protein
MVGFMPEQIRWSGQQTIRETITEFAHLQGCSIQSTEEILSIVGLKNRTNSSLDSLSQGMRQRLSLAVALLGTPKVLVLDEPFNGMDPVAIDAFKRLLRTLANNGIAVVISSHHLSELDHLVDSIALLHRGQLLGHGSIESLQSKLGFEEMTEIVLSQEINDSIIDSLNIIEHTETGQEHRYIFDSSHPELLATLIEQGYEISTWRIIPPTLIELLCAATGLDRDAIGMDVGQSNMIPLRTLGGEEE